MQSLWNVCTTTHLCAGPSLVASARGSPGPHSLHRFLPLCKCKGDLRPPLLALAGLRWPRCWNALGGSASPATRRSSPPPSSPAMTLCRGGYRRGMTLNRDRKGGSHPPSSPATTVCRGGCTCCRPSSHAAMLKLGSRAALKVRMCAVAARVLGARKFTSEGIICRVGLPPSRAL
eukprot:1157161-Pelagomonas_calceolata.AAC.8